ncbi:hypothetical protein CCACVL1_09823 [Corchorus capsularis]|uniref:Uncharacterized protein n=1 Tax=Corchorus capsularis TaxID=210143 RepID=A0A1R3IU02_COCAP|nr:hypothetical protein CCACVL1_09823 [Corchorus capsularis]
MEAKLVKGLSLKALVDVEKNRVVFVESEDDFIDILLSFLTMPIGSIIRLIRDQPPVVGIGCMGNLYESVENLDMQFFRTEACKSMLLHPRNGAAAQCASLKLTIDNSEPLQYFCCESEDCTFSQHKLLSHYRNANCGCGRLMSRKIDLTENKEILFDARNRGVFVKGLARMIVSDELKIMPPATATSFSLLSNLGLTDGSTIEERVFNIGVNQVLNLLRFSLVSRNPLTETLLKKSVDELHGEGYNQESLAYNLSQVVEESSNKYKSIVSYLVPHLVSRDKSIVAKLIISKSRKMVCYAEVDGDFVDLLFSFLTLPLGHVAKEMKNHTSTRGCINHLYNSVQDPDFERFLKSDDHKAMLISPKLAPGFKLGNQPLGVEEYKHHRKFYYSRYIKLGSDVCFRPSLACDETLLPAGYRKTLLSVMDPKSQYTDNATSSGGFVIGSTMFKVTDNLIITPISPMSGLSVLSELKVPFSDIEERVVHVGREEFSDTNFVPGDYIVHLSPPATQAVFSVWVTLLSQVDTSSNIKFPESSHFSEATANCKAVSSRLMQFWRGWEAPKVGAELPMKNNNISLKAVVDKSNNRVVFVESDEKFVDIVFSFLTMPMGSVVRLTRNRPPAAASIGCMNNLYNSVEILDKRYFRTQACKTMLLYPRNGAGNECKNLKLVINDGVQMQYLVCETDDCAISNYKLLSHYRNAICRCGNRMNWRIEVKERKPTRVVFDDQDEGVFVKGPIQLTISDELQVMPSSTPASLSLFSKLGIKDTSGIEERTFLMGELEALSLLKCLLVSKTPLTEALLELEYSNLVVLGPNNMEDVEKISFRKSVILEGPASDEDDGKIYVKLMVSKSRNMVCYAEASEKFVELLFSFLTVPIGFIVKEMQESSSRGNHSINNLYDSIQDLDATQHLRSKKTTAMLVSPKLAPGFSYEGQLLNIEEYMHQPYYYVIIQQSGHFVTSDEMLIHSEEVISSSVLTVIDPKSPRYDTLSGRGFLKGPAMFTITDDLTITPLSSVTGLSAIRKLKVPFSDLEEHVVYVGKEEDLDAKQYLKSQERNAMLLSPKLAPGFGYENQLLGIEENRHPQYYYSLEDGMLVSDKTLLPSGILCTVSDVTVMDPKSDHKDKKSGRGFLSGPALFTISDDLNITAISSISGLSLLNKLNVPYDDIEECTVNVGEEELLKSLVLKVENTGEYLLMILLALRLLVASFISKSALTNALLLKEPTNAIPLKEPKQEI